MKPKERLLVALDRGTPDRLPATVHQWQKYHLDNYMGGVDELEAFEACGLDASITHIRESGQFFLPLDDFSPFSTPLWRDEVEVLSRDPDDWLHAHTVATPGGKLTYKTAGGRMTTWVAEFMVKRDDDIELIRKYMPVPALDVETPRKLYDKIGDRGILRGMPWGDQAGCWQHAACLVDPEDLILACFDRPGWVHEFLSILLEKKLGHIETMKGAKYDLVETGGGASSTTLISPKIHEEFCLPYDRKLHDALHALGFRVVYHTCGGTSGIEEMIAANGCDASETLSPPGVGGNSEPWEFKEKVGGRIALIGGMDQINLLTRGSESDIRAMVRTLFEKVGCDGGYIMSACDHFFEAPPRNLRAFAEAARECVYKP